MEPKSENSGILYLDGLPVSYGQIQLSEITAAKDEAEIKRAALLAPMEFTMSIKTPKFWRCKSRRRFIKLLRSC